MLECKKFQAKVTNAIGKTDQVRLSIADASSLLNEIIALQAKVASLENASHKAESLEINKDKPSCIVVSGGSFKL